MAAPPASKKKNGMWAEAVLLFTAFLSDLLRPVLAQADTGQVTGAVNFLDAGLTALGAFSAFATTLARKVLHVECAQREYVWVKEMFIKADSADKGRWLVANGRPNNVHFSVLASEESVHTAKQVVTYVTTASKLRGEVLVVRHIDGCTSCLLCATDSNLVQAIFEYDPISVVYGCKEVGALSLIRCSSCVCANRFPIGSCRPIILTPGDFMPLDLESDNAPLAQDKQRLENLLHYLVSARYNWSPAGGQLLLAPLPKLNTEAIDTAVEHNAASKDEDSRGDLQPLLRTLEAGEKYYKGQRDSTAELSTSIHYMGLLELVVACFLAILFRVDPLSSFLVSRRVVSSFMTNTTGRSLHAGWYLSKIELVVWQEGGSNVYALSPLGGSAKWLKSLHPILVGIATIAAFSGWSCTIMVQAKWQFSINYSLKYETRTVAAYASLLAVGFVLSVWDAVKAQTKGGVNLDGGYGMTSEILRSAVYSSWCIFLAASLIIMVITIWIEQATTTERLIGVGYILASLGSWCLWFITASAREAESRLGIPPQVSGTLNYAFTYLYIAMMSSVSGPWRSKP